MGRHINGNQNVADIAVFHPDSARPVLSADSHRRNGIAHRQPGKIDLMKRGVKLDAERTAWRDRSADIGLHRVKPENAARNWTVLAHDPSSDGMRGQGNE